MRKILLFLTAVALIAGYTAIPAVAHWVPEDGHKMHYPQTPKPGGWDVSFTGGRLADDWLCPETGPVKDIHFWISFKDDNVQAIGSFGICIYSNLPANHPDNQYGYSMPDSLLWESVFTSSDFTITECDPDSQGWYDPQSEDYEEKDHTRRFQINIDNIQEPFIQQKGNIYWLEIDFWEWPGSVGWKETNQHWNDDAVFFKAQAPPLPCWIELRDPEYGTSIDLAFVITGPTNGPIPTLSQWCLIFLIFAIAGFSIYMIRRRRVRAT